jgi:hypothetical protein
MHGSTRRALPMLVALLLITPARTATALVDPVPVKATPARELFPAAGADADHTYLAWTRVDAGGSYRAVLSIDRAGRMQMGGGTALDVFSGSLWDGGVVLQVVRAQDSDLMRYDIATGSTARISDRTSDGRWQWRPTASGPWLLFGENRFDERSPWRVILMNIVTGEERVLDRSASRCRCISPGQVNGDFAVWTKGAKGDVFRYRISTGVTREIPDPRHLDQFAPSVSADGTVFYVEAGLACGTSATLYRYDRDGTVTQLFQMAPNREPLGTSAFDEGDGTVTLYFDRYVCDTGASDILKIPAADTASLGRGQPAGPSGLVRRDLLLAPQAETDVVEALHQAPPREVLHVEGLVQPGRPHGQRVEVDHHPR